MTRPPWPSSLGMVRGRVRTALDLPTKRRRACCVTVWHWDASQLTCSVLLNYVSMEPCAALFTSLPCDSALLTTVRSRSGRSQLQNKRTLKKSKLPFMFGGEAPMGSLCDFQGLMFRFTRTCSVAGDWLGTNSMLCHSCWRQVGFVSFSASYPVPLNRDKRYAMS